MATTALQNRFARLASEFASLNAAITAIGATKTQLILEAGTALALTGNVTIPANVAIDPRGGVIDVDIYALTINGLIRDPGPVQVFDVSGGGTVTMGAGVQAVRPEWIGEITHNSTIADAHIAWAFGSGRPVLLQGITYLHSSRVTATAVPKVDGVEGFTIFKPSGAFADVDDIAFVINSQGAYQPVSKWRHVDWDGSGSTGLTGLVLGNHTASAVSGAIDLKDCYVYGFTGTGANGLHVKNTVASSITNSTFNGSAVNVIIEGDSPALLPTTTRFSGCNFREAVTAGVIIRSGEGIKFDQHCVFESNGEHGLLIQPDTVGAIIRHLDVADSWFENNWTSLSSPSRDAEHSIYVDGTTVSISGPIHFRRCRWGETCKPMEVNGANVVYIDAPEVPGSANTPFFEITSAGLVNFTNYTADLFTVASWTAASSAVARDGWIVARLNWSPGNIVDGAQAGAGLAVAEAAFGRPVVAAASVNVQGQILTADVQSAGNVAVYLQNETGGAINLGTIDVDVYVKRL